jgi:hypothetical protein
MDVVADSLKPIPDWTIKNSDDAIRHIARMIEKEIKIIGPAAKDLCWSISHEPTSVPLPAAELANPKALR